METARFHPSSEQLALGRTITESLDELLPLSRLHISLQEQRQTWESIEDIGVFSIGVSESRGGSGLGAVEEALIVMGLGRRLASPGILATLATAQIDLPGAASGLAGRRVAAGYRRNERIIVVGESDTTFLLVRDNQGAAVHRVEQTQTEPVDSRLWAADLKTVSAIGHPLAQLKDQQLSRLRLIDAAALAGMADAVLEMAVAYAGIRQQFGRPIGTFQAVKHHCANMAIAARCARDQTNFAAVALDQSREDAQLHVECAFFVAASAALDNAALNIQIHGGMGFSDEADAHLFLKRAQLAVAVAGGLEAAIDRIASAKAVW